MIAYPPDRVVVFIDYQNAHNGALRAFHPPNTSPVHGHFNPRALALLLTEKRTSNGFPSKLAEVRVYRGKPSPDRQAAAAAANDRQADAWSRLPDVHVVRRPLRYPRPWPNEPAQEKGVDVALAVDVISHAHLHRYEVGIVFSADTDLVPALEAVVDLQLAHVEVGAWKGQHRLRFPSGTAQRLWCHTISSSEYQRIQDNTNYSRPRP